MLTINLDNNYWGTTNTTQIAAKITDPANSNLPTVTYTPLSAASPAGVVSATAARQHVHHIQLLLPDDHPQRHRHQRVDQYQRGE